MQSAPRQKRNSFSGMTGREAKCYPRKEWELETDTGALI